MVTLLLVSIASKLTLLVAKGVNQDTSFTTENAENMFVNAPEVPRLKELLAHCSTWKNVFQTAKSDTTLMSPLTDATKNSVLVLMEPVLLVLTAQLMKLQSAPLAALDTT